MQYDQTLTRLLREAITEATENGSSVRQVAGELGLSYSGLLRFVNGKQSISLKSADLLASLFGIQHVKDSRNLTDRPARSREHTAYHEAGHAVAAVVLHRPFRYATIRPEEDSLGHVMFQAFSEKFSPDISVGLRDADFIERCSTCSYAGAAGAGLLSGQDFDWAGAGADRQHALNMVSYVDGEPDALGAHLELLTYRARNLIRSHSAAVERVAEKLLREETIKAKTVKALIWPDLPPLDPRLFEK